MRVLRLKPHANVYYGGKGPVWCPTCGALMQRNAVSRYAEWICLRMGGKTMTDSGVVRAFVDEINALRAEKHQYRDALEGLMPAMALLEEEPECDAEILRAIYTARETLASREGKYDLNVTTRSRE